MQEWHTSSRMDADTSLSVPVLDLTARLKNPPKPLREAMYTGKIGAELRMLEESGQKSG
jgi:hypothetical protein